VALLLGITDGHGKVIDSQPSWEEEAEARLSLDVDHSGTVHGRLIRVRS
jgi:hypothetical protein